MHFFRQLQKDSGPPIRWPRDGKVGSGELPLRMGQTQKMKGSKFFDFFCFMILEDCFLLYFLRFFFLCSVFVASFSVWRVTSCDFQGGNTEVKGIVKGNEPA